MRRSTRILLSLLVALPVALVLGALVYQWGMGSLEGSPRGFWRSLEFAAETLSTTGFGADNQWSSPAMVLLVVVLQLAGMSFSILIVPAYLVPLLEERFEERLPRVPPTRLQDHVVIYRFGPAVEALVETLEAAGVPSLVIETDESAARLLIERRVPVVFRRDEEDALAGANMMKARALVANGRDDESAALVLRARQMDFRGPICALTADPLHRRPMELAGASVVFTPRHILAAALAAQASDKISPRLAGIQQLGGHLEVRELRLQQGSPLVGQTLGESRIVPRSGAAILGQWVGGRLHARPGPEMRLEARGILIALGTPETLERLARLAEGTTPLRREGHFLVAGFGEVGHKVQQMLADAGEETRVIDRERRTGVDLVGDVLDPAVLKEAALDGTRAVILALDSDDATLFATVILQDRVPEAPVIARVNHARNVDNIYRAGADFALSISKVSAQMLSHQLLGSQSLALHDRLLVEALPTGALLGQHPQAVALPDECSIVAVERGDDLVVDFAGGFSIAGSDTVYLAGSDAAVLRVRDQAARR